MVIPGKTPPRFAGPGLYERLGSDHSEWVQLLPDHFERRREDRDEARAEDETAAPKSSDKPRKERPKRDYKRKDDDLILDPAPDDLRGFGDDVPAFLK